MQINHPDLWRQQWCAPGMHDHKYSRGYTLVIGGAEMTGAARLAATAALRIGSGMVVLLAPPAAFTIYAAALTSVLVRRWDDASLDDWLDDARISACIIGPGLGVGEATRRHVLSVLDSQKPVLLDADALNSFADDPPALFAVLHARALLTPHAGEFARLFPAEGDKPAITQRAAALCGAVVLHKGADTVIAGPDGACISHRHASPYLATAGTGDVLAGLCGGLLAQGLAPLHAACAGAWIHGEAARRFGPGLIAEDLPAVVPVVLNDLYKGQAIGS